MRLAAQTRWLVAVLALLSATALAAPPEDGLVLQRVTAERLLPAESVLDGRSAVLVAVFATWCRPCRAEVPMLNRLARDLDGRGVRVVAVSVDDDEPGVVARFATEHALVYPVYYADAVVREGRSLLGVLENVPTLVLVSDRGAVLRRWVGVVGDGPLRAALMPLVGR